MRRPWKSTAVALYVLSFEVLLPTKCQPARRCVEYGPFVIHGRDCGSMKPSPAYTRPQALETVVERLRTLCKAVASVVPSLTAPRFRLPDDQFRNGVLQPSETLPVLSKTYIMSSTSESPVKSSTPSTLVAVHTFPTDPLLWYHLNRSPYSGTS